MLQQPRTGSKAVGAKGGQRTSKETSDGISGIAIGLMGVVILLVTWMLSGGKVKWHGITMAPEVRDGLEECVRDVRTGKGSAADAAFVQALLELDDEDIRAVARRHSVGGKISMPDFKKAVIQTANVYRASKSRPALKD